MKNVLKGALVALVGMAAVTGMAGVANAQVAMVDGPTREMVNHNEVTYHRHIPGTNWTYVELEDGSEWTATPCKTPTQRNCWSKTRFYLNLKGHRHYEEADLSGGRPRFTTPPFYPQRMARCVWEDGSGGPLPCVWDGRHSGNGHGLSYVVYSVTPFVAEYMSHERAHRLWQPVR